MCLEQQASHKYTQGDTWHSSKDHMQNTRVLFLLQIEGEGLNLLSVWGKHNLKTSLPSSDYLSKMQKLKIDCISPELIMTVCFQIL